MAEETLIAWTDHTFNAWLVCTKVSAGCTNCYAEPLATPWDGVERLGADRRPEGDDDALAERADVGPCSCSSERRRVFCGSIMYWAEGHPVANRTRAAVWELVRECSLLDWQMLTKRPHRIRECLPKDWGSRGYANVWLGTSVEDMRVADRVDHLRDIPAVVRLYARSREQWFFGGRKRPVHAHRPRRAEPFSESGTPPAILCPAALCIGATVRDPRPRRPHHPHPLHAAQAQGHQLGRARPRPQVHAAEGQWRRRTLAV